MLRFFFFASIGLSALLPGVFAQPDAKPADFCSALRTSATKRTSVRGKLLMTYSTVGRVDGGESFFYSPECNGPDSFALADSSRLSNRNKLDKFLSSLPAEKDFVLEAEVSGIVETSLIPSFGHLSWSRAKLEIRVVYTVRNVTGSRKTVSPNLEAPAPIADRGEYLRNVNALTMFAILGAWGHSEGFQFLSDAFTLTHADGRAFRKDDLASSLNRLVGWLDGGERRVTTPDTVAIDGSFYTATGDFSVEVKAGHTEKYRYENTFVLSNDDSFSLIKSKFTKPPHSIERKCDY